jgi:glutathione-regulated potassium-efflux system ancillary protein KefG
MKVLVNLFHPQFGQSRVHRCWWETLQQDPSITVSLMYDENPAWQFDLQREQSRLLSHDRIVLQFPFYWYSSPALVKKWLDDVLAYNWAYGPEGAALKGKEWVIATSTGGPADSYVAGGYNQYSMSEFMKPFQQTANLIQATFLPPYVLHNALRVSDEALRESAKAYAAYLKDPEVNPAVRLARLSAEMKAKNITL